MYQTFDSTDLDPTSELECGYHRSQRLLAAQQTPSARVRHNLLVVAVTHRSQFYDVRGKQVIYQKVPFLNPPSRPTEVFFGGFREGSSKLNFGWLRTTNRRVGCGERIVKFNAVLWPPLDFFSLTCFLFLYYCFYRRCSVQ